MPIDLNPLNGLNSATKFSPDRFRAAVTLGLGLAANNRFEVELPEIRGMTKVDGTEVHDETTSEDRVMLCTAAQMPGKDINITPRGIGIDQQQIAMGHTMAPVSLTFYLTNTYSLKHYFQEWQECITSQSPTSSQHVGYYDNYTGKKGVGKTQDIRIRQYSRNARRVYSVKLHECFPVSVNAIELNNAGQASALELTVQIQYRTYTPDRETWADGLTDKLKNGVADLKDKFL